MATASSEQTAALQQQLVKEYRWFNSHSLPLEIQVGVTRLELSENINTVINGLENYIVTCHIIFNQLKAHDPPMSTLFSQPDHRRNSLIWEQVLCLPIKIRDLTLDALLVFTVWSAEGVPLGGTSMRLFDDAGCLKQGKQKLLFFHDTEADPNVLIQHNKTPGEYYEIFAKHDYDFLMEKNFEKYRYFQTSNSKADYRHEWLDRLLMKRIEQAQETPVYGDRTNAELKEFTQKYRNEFCGTSLEEVEMKKYSFLVIEMPTLAHQVLFEEKQYPSVDPHYPPTSLHDVLGPCIVENNADDSVLEFSLVGKQFNASWLTVVADWDMGQENVSEEQNRRLCHNTRRGAADSTVKPNKDEKMRIENMIQSVGSQISTIDMDFLYRFRYSLTENKKALIKFLYCVNWDEDNEVAELPILLALWKEKAPIDVADALKLLSKEKSFEHPFVREFAVEVLRSAADEELLSFLLQLVQALRYEPASSNQQTIANVTSIPSLSSLNVDFPLENSVLGALPSTPGKDTPSSSLPPAPPSPVPVTSSGSSVDFLSPLAKFLIDRACASPTVANFLYWYLKVETEDEVSGLLFESVFDQFIVHLSQHSEESKAWLKRLMALDNYILTILACQRDARNQGKRKEAKEQALIKLLAERKLQSAPASIEWLPMPLDPSIKITGLIPETASMFASAIYPCVIEFNTLRPEGEVVVPGTKNTVKMMFKSGDDLRQDQLIMQMIALMDGLLKKVNLDLKLLTYGILAVGQKDGIMEFVRNSTAVSSVTKNYGSIAEYLRHHNPDKTGPYEISAKALDTFVKSCAGYCVITYILGVGDRHLDNVMMNSSGQLFHIDFGFIFGQDPKPFPPPFRFTRSMADAMGGEDSEHYARFKSYCCQAYNWLRKSANLILNLLSLMGDAGIQDISKRSDLSKVLLKVEEKFRLDLTDEQAEQYFLGLINESLHSLAPKVMELAHKIAVSMR